MVRSKLFIFITVFFFLHACCVYAEDLLTWEECVRQAQKNHPDLISAAEEVEQAKADKVIEISPLLPEITTELSGKTSKTTTQSASGVYSVKTQDAYTSTITGKQYLFDGFKTSNKVADALKTIEAQEYNYELVSSNVRLDLRNAFVGLLKAQELILLTQEIAERRKQNLEMIKLRYKAGREHKGALLTAEADLSQAEFEVAQAKRNISLARRELSAAMGLDTMKAMSVQGDFSVEGNYQNKPDFEHLADTTPFLKELIAKKEAARYNLKSSKADFLPTVYLSSSASKKNDTWPPRQDEWSAGLTVSLPLFEGASRIAEVKKARSQLNQAEADQRSGRDSVLVTLETTYKDLKDTIANVSVQKKFLEAAQERANIANAQYETGLVSFDDWIIIENNLVSAKKTYLNARADMLIAEAYWIQAIGGTLNYGEK